MMEQTNVYTRCNQIIGLVAESTLHSRKKNNVEKIEPNIDPSLYKNIKVNAAEIVYEVTTYKNGLPFGIAIADIQQSEPHYHQVTIEIYTVVQGELEVSLDTDQYTLNPGDVIKISPGVIHSAKSLSQTPARITVITIPEFSQDDYYPWY